MGPPLDMYSNYERPYGIIVIIVQTQCFCQLSGFNNFAQFIIERKENKAHLTQFIQSTTCVKCLISFLIHCNSCEPGQGDARSKGMPWITEENIVETRKNNN